MRRILASYFSVVIMVACSGSVSREVTPLFSTVPSRSAAVMHFDDCRRALKLVLDSTSVFRSLDYGRMENAEIILSYDYSAGLIPLLSIDAGRSTADTSASVRHLLEQAASAGLYSYYTADMLSRRSAVLLSPSRPLIAEAQDHIISGSSILDAQGFPAALDLSSGEKGSIILKNGSASRLLPRNILKDYFSRKELVRFFSGLAEWTVLSFNDYAREGIDVRFCGDGNGKYLSTMVDGLRSAPSELSSATPVDVDFVLGLALKDPKAYQSAWENCLDVRAELSKYKGRLAALKRNSGKSPLSWWTEKSPRELAVVRWDGHEALLMRPAKKARAVAPGPNPYPGFIPALLGEAFRVVDDSCCASEAGWLVYGSETDVLSWMEAVKGAKLPKKAIFCLLNPEFSISADSDKTILNVY